jgi:transcriptional regulator with XRE-family HTH domain
MANEEILRVFGKRIRQLRQERKLSQEDLGFDVGLDRTYVSDIERGTRNIGLKNVYALAKTLGITLSQLFEGVE